MSDAGTYLRTITVDASETVELVWTIRDGAGAIIERYTERHTLPPIGIRQGRAPRWPVAAPSASEPHR